MTIAGSTQNSSDRAPQSGMSGRGFFLTATGSALATLLDKGVSRGRYWKEIIPADYEFKHPVTGERLIWPLNQINAMASESNRYAESQHGRVPFPDGHHVTAMGNLGYWSRYKVEPGSNGLIWLKGLVEPGDDEVESRLRGRIRDVSAYIEPEAVDSHGNVYKNVITHVCATPVPVVHSGNFEPAAALSRDDATMLPRIFVALSKERPMSKRMSKLKTALGIKHDEPDGDEKALDALGFSADDGDEAYSKKVKAMSAAAKLDGEDYPQKQNKILAKERDEAMASFTALSKENQALSARVLSLEFDGMVDKAALKAKGPIDKDEVEWAREEYAAGRPKNAAKILSKAVDRTTAAPQIGVGGAHEVPHPASAMDIGKKKAAVQAGVLMLSRTGAKIETREDGLAFRVAGRTDWIEPSVTV